MSSTVIKGLKILELMVNSPEPLSITEVARFSDLSKSNAYRMLRVLQAEGFLIQNEDSKTFMPSLKIWELGNTVIARRHFVDEAFGVLRWIADETGEAVHLALYDNGQAVTISQIESRQAVRAYTEVGGRAPAYTVATGKAILAFKPASEIESICRRLHQVTQHTITQPQLLRDQLRDIRQSRIAYNDEEWQIGVRGLAAPVLDRNNIAVLAIGLCGPASRVTPSLDSVYTSLLRQGAESLTGQLCLSSKRHSEGPATMAGAHSDVNLLNKA